MSYNQLVKKYGEQKVNKVRDLWNNNSGIRVKCLCDKRVSAVKGAAGMTHKAWELLLKGEI